MNVLKRAKISPVTVVPGDTISLHYTDEFGNTVTHLTDTITKAQTFDEALIFEDVIDGKNALCGAWLEAK